MPEQPARRFADSGDPTDEVHVVHLRDLPAGDGHGEIRGDLPAVLRFRGAVYFLSTFSQRQADGTIVHSYYPHAKGARTSH